MDDLTPTVSAGCSCHGKHYDREDADFDNDDSNNRAVVRSSIEQEIMRFEAVHPAIYALYELIDHVQNAVEVVDPVLLAQEMRDRVMHIEDSFVHSQEWTLARDARDIKIGILGSLHSGKSALVHRYLTGTFLQEESPEGGRFKKRMQIDDQSYLVLIRDEAAAEDTGDASLLELNQFAQWQDAIIFVFALDDLTSFHYVYKMLTALARFRQFNCKQHHQKDGSVILSTSISLNSSCSSNCCTPIILVGTRDRVTPNATDNNSKPRSRVVSDQQIFQLENHIANNFYHCRSCADKLPASSSKHIVFYRETNAKNGSNVDLVFREACCAAISRRYAGAKSSLAHTDAGQCSPQEIQKNYGAVRPANGQYPLPLAPSASGDSNLVYNSSSASRETTQANLQPHNSPVINHNQQIYRAAVVNRAQVISQHQRKIFPVQSGAAELYEKPYPADYAVSNYRQYGSPILTANQQQNLFLQQNNRMSTSPLQQQAAMVGPLFLSHMPMHMPTTSSPLVANNNYGAHPRRRLSTAPTLTPINANATMPPAIPHAVVSSAQHAVVQPVINRIPSYFSTLSPHIGIPPQHQIPYNLAVQNQHSSSISGNSSDSPVYVVQNGNFKLAEGKSRSTSSLLLPNNSIGSRQDSLYDTLARQYGKSNGHGALQHVQIQAEKAKAVYGLATLNRSKTTAAQQAPAHLAGAAHLLRAASAHNPRAVDSNGSGVSLLPLQCRMPTSASSNNTSIYESVPVKQPRKRKSLSLSKKPAELRDDFVEHSASTNHPGIGHGRPIPRKQGFLYKINGHQSIITSTPLLFRSSTGADETDGNSLFSSGGNNNRPRVMSSLFPQRGNKQQPSSSIITAAAGGRKRVRRKKKYCVLLEGGWLAYYPSMNDYMNDKDAKRINLALCTVKIPGRAPHPIESACQRDTGKLLQKDSPATAAVLPNRILNDNQPNAVSENKDFNIGDRSSTLQRKSAHAAAATANGKTGEHKDSSADNSLLSTNASFDFLVISLHNRHWQFECTTCEERDEWAVAVQKEIFDALASGKAASSLTTPSPLSTKSKANNTTQHQKANGKVPSYATVSPGSRSIAVSEFFANHSPTYKSASGSPSYLDTNSSGLQCRPPPPFLGGETLQEQLTLANNPVEMNRMLATDIRRLPAGNDKCADCDSESPSWASLNLGVLLCIDCAGIHRQMGAHISKVRSLDLDDCWLTNAGATACMLNLGNAFANSFLEARLRIAGSGWPKKPPPNAARDARTVFICAKYEKRIYLLPLLPDNDDSFHEKRDKTEEVFTNDSDFRQYQTLLMGAIRVRNLKIVMHVLLTVLLGASSVQLQKFFSLVNEEDRTNMLPFLHTACAAGDLVITQLLLYYGANASQLDGCGRTALEHAYAADSPACVDILLRATGGRTTFNGGTGNNAFRSASALSTTLSESSHSSTVHSTQDLNSEK